MNSKESSPVSELVERLQRPWPKHETEEVTLPAWVIELCDEAADRLTALEAENARLRGHIVEAQKILCEPQDEMVRLVRATITLAQALTARQESD